MNDRWNWGGNSYGEDGGGIGGEGNRVCYD